MAGIFLWILTAALSFAAPALILFFLYRWNRWIGFAAETVMCWQIIALKSLKAESMKVFRALEAGDVEQARKAVSMIVGRDTAALDDKEIARAAVETVAENTSDGVAAPMLFAAIGGAPLGFLYKAVNTMDSMLGYLEAPYANIGFFPAKADDVFNFIPARLSALLMLFSGRILRLDYRNGWRIFRRDRLKHASPNSAQTESACAGLLGIRLGGDACYHGVLHRKPFIGDGTREIETSDIPRSCAILYATSFLTLGVCVVLRFLLVGILELL